MDARRTIPPAMAARLTKDVLFLALLLKVTRQDDTVIGFTTHDQDLTVDGVLYEALSGITASALRTTLGTGIDNMEVMGALTSDRLTEDDLLGERYDLAKIDLYFLDWDAPEIEPIWLESAVLGRVTIRQGQYTTEVVAKGQRLDQQVLRLCAAACSAPELGAAPCYANLTGKVYTVTTIAGSSAEVVTVSGASIPEDDATFFDYGQLLGLTGANAGVKREIKSAIEDGANVEITLAESFPFEPTAGDTWTLTVGCDRRFATCHYRFNNAYNYQGFPQLPGTQKIVEQGRSD